MKVFVYLFIFFITLLQIIFQPLLQDEAYYFFYSQTLSFGYFDHPPMVSWSIALGTLFSQSEWAIRLVYLGYLMGTVYILDKLILTTNNWKYLFLFSFPVMNVIHLALPDSSLLFFTVLFFHVFKKCSFKEKRTFFQEFKLSFLLSFIIAFMVYSKYHAFLTLLFTIVAYPSLFKKWSFYLTLVLSLVLILPHFLWQLEYDFITFRYHFFERTTPEFDVQNVIDFSFSSIFVVFGMFFLFIPSFLKSKGIKIHSISLFNRVLVVNLMGFFVFFLYFSFKGAIEINWLFSASIPAIILMGNQLNFSSLRVKVTVGISVFVIVTIRVLFLSNSVPNYGYLYEVSGYEKWVNSINKRFENKHVIFRDSYQLASLYAYYTHQKPFSFNTSLGRMNQYNLSSNDIYYQNKDVIVIQGWKEWYAPIDTLHTEKGIFQFTEIKNFYCINNLQIINPILYFSSDNYVDIEADIANRGKYPLQQLKKNGSLQLVLTKVVPHHLNTIVLQSNEYEIIENQVFFRIYLPKPLDFNKFRLGFSVNNQPSSGNSLTFNMFD